MLSLVLKVLVLSRVCLLLQKLTWRNIPTTQQITLGIAQVWLQTLIKLKTSEENDAFSEINDVDTKFLYFCYVSMHVCCSQASHAHETSFSLSLYIYIDDVSRCIYILHTNFRMLLIGQFVRSCFRLSYWFSFVACINSSFEPFS